MKMLKEGDKGEDVKTLQRGLGLKPDGVFGPMTKRAVVKFQLSNNITPDGIVGNETWALLLGKKFNMDNIDQDTDVKSQYYRTNYNQLIHKYYLPKGEYIPGPIKNEFVFLHHTAGWDNPYKVIDDWARDHRGEIATEFVIGGQNIRNGDRAYDGMVIQAFPKGAQGWHLGATGSGYMNRHSVGIELTNFGFLDDDNRTYTNAVANIDQVRVLDQPFKTYRRWHDYSEAQITELHMLLLHIAERDNIDLRKGLVQWIKKYGPIKGFDFQEDAHFGKVKGLMSHTNVRKDKTDCYPHPALVDMLMSL